MSAEESNGIIKALSARQSATPAPLAPDPLAGLTNAEREIVLYMRRMGIERTTKERMFAARWNGARIIVFDMVQS